ncbi:MAG: biotin--[acetyl-CoA-carboxylase] ligase [Lachnospiraceae bacterium]|nr:biotin--[acetyl-CoA-carboxylase] ligase [Lachnospiraceae bacterium]
MINESMMDNLDIDWIKNRLKINGINICTLYYAETGSTNEDAAREIKKMDFLKNALDGILVIADKQNSGRGRKGRSFFSPEGTGLYMSLAVPYSEELIKTVKVTSIAAVAVAEAIDELIFENKNVTGIKWVNDIYIYEKKICGILTEAFMPEKERAGGVVIGIGINVYEPLCGIPNDLKNKAGYILTKEAGEINILKYEHGLRNSLAVSIIRKLLGYIRINENYYDIYKQKSILIGKYVYINSYKDDNNNETALVMDIDPECRLAVQYDDGSIEALSSGEVSVVKKQM